MPRLDPYESLGFHCNLTLKSFVSALEGKLKGTGVSSAQFMALAHLIALGPLSQSELADRLSITPATAVRLVDRMERDGWVFRQIDTEDGRVKRIVPTDQTAKAWEEVSRAGRALLDQAYQGVHPAEIETVKRVLERIRRNLTS
ncbi:MAG: MarR family transcriptional regulator [Deltaproteobacteria bacterium]|nr:MarR family transcriptional regulator [Deltaproteobacteria bacterium]